MLSWGKRVLGCFWPLGNFLYIEKGQRQVTSDHHHHLRHGQEKRQLLGSFLGQIFIAINLLIALAILYCICLTEKCVRSLF
jgi:hypothetical protein